MAVTLNASTTTGLVQSADTSGIIELQNNGTTKLTVNSSGATIPTAIVTTLSDGTNSTSATNCIQGSAKAWVNFAGASGTINGSFNVSSVTRVSTGIYTVTFTTSMPNANYAISVTPSSASGQGYAIATVNDANIGTAPTTSAFQFTTRVVSSGAGLDTTYAYASVFSS